MLIPACRRNSTPPFASPSTWPARRPSTAARTTASATADAVSSAILTQFEEIGADDLDYLLAKLQDKPKTVAA